MDTVQKQSERIRRQLEELDNETLVLIYKDYAKAMEYVKKGLRNISVEELSNKSLEDIAHEMQIVAKIELNQRTLQK